MLDKVIDDQNIADRLGHLLALDLDKAVMHPDVDESLAVMGTDALGDLVFVVWKLQIGAAAMSTPWLYRVGSQMLKRLQAPLVSEGWIAKLPPPLNRWTMSRPFPAFAADFRRWWRSRKAGC